MVKIDYEDREEEYEEEFKFYVESVDKQVKENIEKVIKRNRAMNEAVGYLLREGWDKETSEIIVSRSIIKDK